MRYVLILLLLAGCASNNEVLDIFGSTKDKPGWSNEVVAPDAEARGEQPGKPRNVKVYEAK